MSNKCTGKDCPSGKICNPKTGRCVTAEGNIGQRILKRQAKAAAKAASPKRGSPKRTPPASGKCVGKSCKAGEVCNPATGRCVKKTGAIGQKIMSGIPVSPKKKASPKKKSPSRDRCAGKSCKAGEVCNPASGRCVKKSGAIGKKILAGSVKIKSTVPLTPKEKEEVKEAVEKVSKGSPPPVVKVKPFKSTFKSKLGKDVDKALHKITKGPAIGGASTVKKVKKPRYHKKMTEEEAAKIIMGKKSPPKKSPPRSPPKSPPRSPPKSGAHKFPVKRRVRSPINLPSTEPVEVIHLDEYKKAVKALAERNTEANRAEVKRLANLLNLRQISVLAGEQHAGLGNVKLPTWAKIKIPRDDWLFNKVHEDLYWREVDKQPETKWEDVSPSPPVIHESDIKREYEKQYKERHKSDKYYSEYVASSEPFEGFTTFRKQGGYVKEGGEWVFKPNQYFPFLPPSEKSPTYIGTRGPFMGSKPSRRGIKIMSRSLEIPRKRAVSHRRTRSVQRMSLEKDYTRVKLNVPGFYPHAPRSPKYANVRVIESEIEPETMFGKLFSTGHTPPRKLSPTRFEFTIPEGVKIRSPGRSPIIRSLTPGQERDVREIMRLIATHKAKERNYYMNMLRRKDKTPAQVLAMIKGEAGAWKKVRSFTTASGERRVLRARSRSRSPQMFIARRSKSPPRSPGRRISTKQLLRKLSSRGTSRGAVRVLSPRSSRKLMREARRSRKSEILAYRRAHGLPTTKEEAELAKFAADIEKMMESQK